MKAAAALAVLIALTASVARTQTIYPLTRAEILTGAKFDMRKCQRHQCRVAGYPMQRFLFCPRQKSPTQ